MQCSPPTRVETCRERGMQSGWAVALLSAGLGRGGGVGGKHPTHSLPPPPGPCPGENCKINKKNGCAPATRQGNAKHWQRVGSPRSRGGDTKGLAAPLWSLPGQHEQPPSPWLPFTSPVDASCSHEAEARTSGSGSCPQSFLGKEREPPPPPPSPAVGNVPVLNVKKRSSPLLPQGSPPAPGA